MITHVPHCERCCFGTLEYQCPACGKQVRDDGDAAVGWESGRERRATKCPACRADLILDPVGDAVTLAGNCEACGMPADVYPEPPAPAYCPAHCPAHEYEYDNWRRDYFCAVCDRQKPRE